MKKKIKILSLEGKVLFEHETENNSIKITIEEAVKQMTDLYGANLRGASLYGACLCGANLSGASLYGANLRGADLMGAKDVPYIPLACPSEGSFVGWKKVKGKLVKLEIPEDAKRSSATTRKCRCDKAKVLAITNLDDNSSVEQVMNNNYTKTMYRVGEMVYPDDFDEDRWNGCSHGIHFFINKQDAIDY